jgi:uncharacterized membrane protein YccC
MNGWEVLNNVISTVPPVTMALLLTAAVVAAVIFIIGFSRHGVDFIRHGFRQNLIGDLVEKLATRDDINRLDAKIGDLNAKIGALDAKFEEKIGALDAKFGEKIGGIEAKLVTIETNHFGHLKNFLTELTSILVDKGIINNENKARLDNHLRGM